MGSVQERRGCFFDKECFSYAWLDKHVKLDVIVGHQRQNVIVNAMRGEGKGGGISNYPCLSSDSPFVSYRKETSPIRQRTWKE